LSYAPGLRAQSYRGLFRWQDPPVQRRLLGVLFSVLAAGFGLIAVFSALEGGRALVIALAAAVLALWMGGLARRAFGSTR